jgi:hypothetical protein
VGEYHNLGPSYRGTPIASCGLTPIHGVTLHGRFANRPYGLLVLMGAVGGFQTRPYLQPDACGLKPI